MRKLRWKFWEKTYDDVKNDWWIKIIIKYKNSKIMWEWKKELRYFKYKKSIVVLALKLIKFIYRPYLLGWER